MSTLTPIWLHVTYFLQHGSKGVTSKVHTTPDEFWGELARSYRKDQLITIKGDLPHFGFPARQILSVQLRACQPHEIPQEG
jgi:hypothetical protein